MESTNYSLADIATAAGRTDGFGGNNFLYLLLFAMIFGNGFGGYGRGDYGNFASAASQQEILFGQRFQNLDNKADRLGNGIADATFSLMASQKDGAYANLQNLYAVKSDVDANGANIINAVAGVQAAVKDCCCTTQRAIDSVNYNGAINTAAINANTTAQTQKILDALAQDKIASLQAQVNNLTVQNAISQATAGVVKYPNATTYSAGTSCFGNSGCCGCNG